MNKRISIILSGGVTALLLATSIINAHAAKGDYFPLTAGSNYDRNPSVITDGSNDLWLFFARSQASGSAADRLQGANVDNMPYDLYYMRSTNNGKTWGTPTLLAVNPGPADIFRGRTVAATRRSDGTIFVFWASGGSGSNLYVFSKAPNASTFTPAPGRNVTAVDSYFNVEAVSRGMNIFVYYENAYGGVFAMTFDGTSYSAPVPVAAMTAIPKVIIDRSGTFRMAAADAAGNPVVSVVVSSSTNGLNWSAPITVVPGNGTVTNWDPNLTQTADGNFRLIWAPDQGDGSQRIETRTSSDFVSWSPAQQLTEGFDGTNRYWDYWPEGLAHGDKVSLFYTSERGLGGDPGIAHIWTTRLQ